MARRRTPHGRWVTAWQNLRPDGPWGVVKPVISGPLDPGSTIGVTDGTVPGYVKSTTQWLVSYDGGLSYSEIGGATGNSYTIPSDDLQAIYKVTNTYSNGMNAYDVDSDPSPPVGGPLVYVDPDQWLGFYEGDAEFDAYAEQVLQSCGRCKWHLGAASGGHPKQTYAAFTHAFDALPDEQKECLAVVNMEFPWLAIGQRLDADGVDAAWRTDPACVAEGTRQGIDPATCGLSGFRDMMKGLWRDCATYALANGSTGAIHYASRVSISAYTGCPRAGIRSSPPSNGKSWWLAFTGHASAGSEYASLVAGNGIATLALAQSTATWHAISTYAFVPLGARADADYANWTSGDVIRKDSGGSMVTPDFANPDLQHWLKATIREAPELWRSACDAAIAAGDMTSLGKNPNVAAIVFGPGVPALLGGAIDFQHWIGFDQKDVADWAAAEIASFWSGEDADSPTIAPPRAIVLWSPTAYYFVTQATNLADGLSTDAAKASRRMRNAIEIELFGREKSPAGDPCPYGSTNTSTQDAWYARNCLGDGWWNDDSEGPWWTPRDGSLLPDGLVIDDQCPIAPWLDFTASIGRTEVVLAIRHHRSTKMVAAGAAAVSGAGISVGSVGT